MPTLDGSDLQGDVEMSLAITGAYRSTKKAEERKVRIMTHQGHVLKLDGTTGTAAIVMGQREYGTVVAFETLSLA